MLKTSRAFFGQIIVGPPGAGKTTYCWKTRDALVARKRNVITINLDPAGETAPFQFDVDVRELIKLEDAMAEWDLGPNGALLRCIEYLSENLQWLTNKMNSFQNGTYFLIDTPGQIELYCHHSILSNILLTIQNETQIKLCAVHLVDSHHCSDAGKFISALIVSLAAMLRLGLPHINVLSKADTLKKRKHELQFGLDFYAQVLDLEYLVETLDEDPLAAKHRKLTSALASIVQDYSLVSFSLLDSYDSKSLANLEAFVDRANGYGFRSAEGQTVDSMLACALGAKPDDGSEYH